MGEAWKHSLASLVKGQGVYFVPSALVSGDDSWEGLFQGDDEAYCATGVARTQFLSA